MAVQIIQSDSTNVVEVHLSGKLQASDYEHLVPKLETAIKEHGKLRLMVVLNDFHGWGVGALWEDLKFDFKHYSDFEKIVIVGQSKWHEGMAKFCTPFTSASVEYFDEGMKSAAANWLCKVGH